MSEVTLVDVVLRQFVRSWQMFEDAVRQFPADEWREGAFAYLTPARAAYHIVETAEFYSGEIPDTFQWGHRFGGDWEAMPAEDLPSPADVLAYLADVRPQVEAWVRDVDLLAPDPAFGWTGGAFLDRALYLLRHTHHHVGEMWSELKRRGYKFPDWH